ncbi:methylcobamide:CoM methyltransferase MtaA [Methanosarcina mazei]|uniref:Methylcobamide:CoM methyltransferase n=1 Tax=Methanosarcina mazei TaxID=2209 RepID=A0A0F8DB19_METMZ|nr:methylcobamide:CoM methyltransferase MtaA [Methanosarcina mazei]KKF99877.1 methylcobamide:CoM methyltransferase [Methanosarcina mazei]KKG34023.1 methylcobamide:CoM methyltransferase [Methanosarcina mazei]KKG35645.1 methylcobamide:CoM methyltransferase [Methanosarcina mazei]KKG64065.1 methylcobamide:CoM methyltransferase [Methanosarcina mazei]KKG79661.1 methylcobamide:CoM methyltransferase [Methanosarcina mazei]
MRELTLNTRFKRALKGESIDMVPVCSVTQTGTVELMEMTGAYWPQANYDAVKMAALALGGYEIAGFENVRCPFCTTVLAETLGCMVDEGSVDIQPYVTDFPCKKKKDVKDISVPDSLLESRLTSVVLDAVEILKERVGEDVPVVAGVVGPAGLASMLAGMRNYLMWFVTNPEVVEELMGTVMEACIEYANGLLERGADAVTLIDSEAGPDIIAPQMFETSVFPLYRKFCKEVKGLKILHMCGDATAVLDPLADSGFEGISIEEKVEVSFAKRIVGDRIRLIGNVSPSDTLLMKGTEEVIIEARACLEDGIDILAPGCGLAPHTPLGNIKALLRARDEYCSL